MHVKKLVAALVVMCLAAAPAHRAIPKAIAARLPGKKRAADSPPADQAAEELDPLGHDEPGGEVEQHARQNAGEY